MYLSKVALDGKRGDTARLMASPHALHGAVESCFCGARRRNLWRIDNLGGNPFLLVLSDEAPDFESLAGRYGPRELGSAWQVKSYDALLSKLAEGQIWQFRLRANPVRSSAREQRDDNARGKLFNHVTQDRQKEWLAARGAQNGFSVQGGSFDVIHAQWFKFRKGDRKGEVSILAVTFEGVLQITNVDLFRSALTKGIGRAKAYGCGLLTIARIKG